MRFEWKNFPNFGHVLPIIVLTKLLDLLKVCCFTCLLNFVYIKKKFNLLKQHQK